jgi:dephospho-CoA kinase
MTMLLLGLAGGKRSGKTLLANLLADKYGLLHTSFAAPIREFTANLLGGTLEQLESRKNRQLHI